MPWKVSGHFVLVCAHIFGWTHPPTTRQLQPLKESCVCNPCVRASDFVDWLSDWVHNIIHQSGQSVILKRSTLRRHFSWWATRFSISRTLSFVVAIIIMAATMTWPPPTTTTLTTCKPEPFSRLAVARHHRQTRKHAYLESRNALVCCCWSIDVKCSFTRFFC